MSPRHEPPSVLPAPLATELGDIALARVLACIDTDALFQFEAELWTGLEQLGYSRRACLDHAQALVDGAFLRLLEARAQVAASERGSAGTSRTVGNAGGAS